MMIKPERPRLKMPANLKRHLITERREYMQLARVLRKEGRPEWYGCVQIAQEFSRRSWGAL